MSALERFLDLVHRSTAIDLARSENDLSSNLKSVFEENGLSAVIDTAGGSSRIKRPDISAYVDEASADLGLAAEIALEAKRPGELDNFPTLLDALVDNTLWNDKFVPYVRSHAERIRYFILTTFQSILIVAIDEELRSRIHEEESYADPSARSAKLAPLSTAFDLKISSGRTHFSNWLKTHATPEALSPPRLSSILDFHALDGADDLESFAEALADVVIGPADAGASRRSLLLSIDLDVENTEELAPDTLRSLMVYTMSVHGGMTTAEAQAHLRQNLRSETQAFVAASIHSLIGRLFAFKTIEDAFCVGVEPPLLPRSNWVFHTTRFDDLPPEDLPQAFFNALGNLGDTDNPAVQDLAATGRFFDWLSTEVDPIVFRRLLDLFFSHTFVDLDGDLLGRFFEYYAQRIDGRRRRELGQYYTPMPIVRSIWRLALGIVEEYEAMDQLLVLDPSVGSGTFLIEGARALEGKGVDRFWEKLHGFDVAPQVIGVAQVNLYLTVLGLLARSQADAVGSLKLFPTDTLDPNNGGQLRSLLDLLSEDAIKSFIKNRITLSERVKRQSRFPLVIGNPPYRHNSNRTLGQMAERFPRLLRSTRANTRAQENTIREDYAWFFAAADHYLAGRGVIAFVVSDSFCYARSFRYFREDLLRNYRVRHLVRLGRFIFRDVGPRTSFVIIVMERRGEPLTSAAETEAIPYMDMSQEVGANVAGTDLDPRLMALDSDQLPDAVEHLPEAEQNYRFYPARQVVSQVLRAEIALVDEERRVFVKKWPGAVSGFDKLFKHSDRSVVLSRIQSLFAASQQTSRRRKSSLDQLATSIRADQKERAKIDVLVEQIQENSLQFDPSRIRRTLTGSAPRSVAWYPNAKMTKWIYYEPRFVFERAINEGRAQGWGNSNQWRDEESHTISPKLAFTVTTNPRAGLKAFVLDDEWLVLKAAGARQQIHYTGVENPLAQARFMEPNNLGPEAAAFHAALTERGRGDEDFLFYIAAIYNSELANEYLVGGGDNKMRIPLSLGDTEIAVAEELIDEGRELRDMLKLAAISEDKATLDHDVAVAILPAEKLLDLEYERERNSGGRFRQSGGWTASDRSSHLISERREVLEASIEERVTRLYDSLPEKDDDQ